MKWFSYSADDGLELHDTADQAEANAKAMIEAYRDESAEGWPDETWGICWGEVKGTATAVDFRDPDETHPNGTCECELSRMGGV